MILDPRGMTGTRVPVFSNGELVLHRLYHYRGVVVSWDLCCQASKEWFKARQGRPDRNQPWYHILVDGSGAAMYAAQEYLDPDPSGEPVRHPLLDCLFRGFVNGRYIRNETPWLA